MKYFTFLFLLVFINSCQQDFINTEPLLYSEKDLQPLTDSIRILYYDDAAYIEFCQVQKDPFARYNQIELNENRILFYQNDLLNIYENCYKMSNSLVENIHHIHTHGTIILYGASVSVDTHKTWSRNWQNGKDTGIAEIDFLIKKHNLEVDFLFESHGRIWYHIASSKPLNTVALVAKLNDTAGFVHVERVGIIGSGSSIRLEKDGECRYYKYIYGWGDCPSGCIYHHYWTIKLGGREIEFVEEGGDDL